jgi:hypothetical protein
MAALKVAIRAEGGIRAGSRRPQPFPRLHGGAQGGALWHCQRTPRLGDRPITSSPAPPPSPRMLKRIEGADRDGRFEAVPGILHAALALYRAISTRRMPNSWRCRHLVEQSRRLKGE